MPHPRSTPGRRAAGRRLTAALTAALTAVGAVASALLLAGPALAAAGPPAAPTLGVTLALTPANGAGLAQLARLTGPVTAGRAAALLRALPGPASTALVVGRARQLGLTVTGTTPLSVQARGPAATVTALFGSARATQPYSAFSHALPAVPAAFAGLVTAAFGGDETRPAARPLLTGGARLLAGTAAVPGLTGAQLRAAYQVPAAALGSGTTIASIQLSGWNAADLTDYAQAAGLTLSAGQYAAVSVDGANPAVADGSGGNTEVDLDQEVLLAVAPAADQRAYFAPNTTRGYLDALDQVLADVGAGQPIRALTTSWGMCEAQAFLTGTGTFSPAVVASYENVLAALTAAGVTVFAASGDSGVQDCTGPGGQPAGNPNGSPALDYPASSPHVVAVGGTTLSDPAAPDRQQGWAGSGGGYSQVFGLPSWQRGLPGAGQGARMVPDISSDANPQTGFGYYGSGPGGAGVGIAGGTSLAAPTQAAMLVDELPAYCATGGLGDIHHLLYAQRGTGAVTGAVTDAVTDVVGGPSNGAYRAVPGYDLVTGLGTPNWAQLTAPTVDRLALSLDPATGPQLLAEWGGGPAPGSRCTTTSFTVTVRSDGQLDQSMIVPPSSTAVRLAGRPGQTYTLTVSTQTSTGASSGPASTQLAVPLDDTALAASPGWREAPNPASFGGGARTSAVPHAWLQARLTGHYFSALVTKTPYSGALSVYVDGVLRGVVSLYAPHDEFRVPIPLARYAADGSHHLAFFVTGTRPPGSTGTAVFIDGLVAYR